MAVKYGPEHEQLCVLVDVNVRTGQREEGGSRNGK